MRYLSQRNRHPRSTVWVLGSGRTLDWVDPDLFARGAHGVDCGFVTVAVNHAALELGIWVPFVVTHHHGMAQEIAEAMPDTLVVTPEVEHVAPEHAHATVPTASNVLLVRTTEQRFGGWDAGRDWPSDPDLLPVGPSSAQLALGWAEFLGAARIVCAGLDCGVVDGGKNLTGHRDYGAEHFHPELWRRALEGSAGVLRSRGIAVHSLNPWVSLHLEGHTFG